MCAGSGSVVMLFILAVCYSSFEEYENIIFFTLMHTFKNNVILCLEREHA